MEHYVRREPIPGPGTEPPVIRSRFWWIRAGFDFLRPTNLLRDRPASGYSSVAPRRPDGTRTKIFPFNGSGWGR